MILRKLSILIVVLFALAVTSALASGGRVPKPKLINLSASTKGQVGARTATYALTVRLPSATKSESVTFRLSTDVATLTFFGGQAGRHTFHQTSGVMPGGTWTFALVDTAKDGRKSKSVTGKFLVDGQGNGSLEKK
jgi:hypothetical protein